MVSWDTNAKLIAGLWPDYKPTTEEKALYAERLGHRRQDWLEEALKRHRSEDADGAFKPRLSKIIAHCQAIADAGDRSISGPSVNEPKDPMDWGQVDRDDAAALAEIASWSVDRRKATVAWARSARMLSEDTLPLARPESWSRWQRGIVAAAGWYMAEHPDRAAKLASIEACLAAR